MLTPVEIQAKTFKSGGLGYDKKDVESFMREVNRSYEILYRENMELKDKVAVLNEGIQYYKSIEKTLQKALVLAEKTAETTKEAANKDAKRIEKEAKVKANILLADAKNELENLHNKTIALLQQYEKYKAQFKNLAQAQIDLLETDAFNINIQKLDVFISEDTDTKDQEKVYDESENDVHELKAENGSPMYQDSFSEEGEEVEFDYTDFEDNDDSQENDLNLSDLGEND
ncbi:MAG: DivIVA domain-containing protein [Lachnospiraceae bacterium]|nr:DivIVA domain-containing protein [Lachnospiraceae bacterium]MBR4144606.1 DivIVA domain-containing protein [Lachnospiraceae bacterium]MBR4776341.1 DivIVA domain-containing protein [Lachnospiraceae bacterium]MBR6476044.1 DivIVA domain-containing protein [Lachnospiraceae bacterium]